MLAELYWQPGKSVDSRVEAHRRRGAPSNAGDVLAVMWTPPARQASAAAEQRP
jgi:hypothetical protein